MAVIKILWIDDEIDLLRSHIIFLENKGYDVNTINNGKDAIELLKKNQFDIIFLDENMPGLSGIETLSFIKQIKASIPVVMITKSEEENIMEEAIGSNIADYLIKPVKPQQILLSIKKNIQQSDLVSKKINTKYQSSFRELLEEINYANSYKDWIKIYKKLVHWELQLNSTDSQDMNDILSMQKSEANNAFAKFVQKNYIAWLSKQKEDKPTFSPDIFKKYIIPELSSEIPTILIVIDNLRYDQWKTIAPIIQKYYQIKKEDIYYSILPTATQYSRNAIFSGLMPLEISKIYPNLWLNDDDEGGKNQYEEDLLQMQLSRLGIENKFYFAKIFDNKQAQKKVDNYKNLLNFNLSVLIFNFVDILSHARTDSKIIRELASNEAAYRSLTLSWFEHSPLLELLKKLSNEKVRIVITTDHGTIKVDDAQKVIGDKRTSSNLRYKTGKNLSYKGKDIFEIKKPKEAHLPISNLSSSYIFASNNHFFAYPNKYNYYVQYYKNTFQHGGISLEEMLIPAIVLETK